MVGADGRNEAEELFQRGNNPSPLLLFARSSGESAYYNAVGKALTDSLFVLEFCASSLKLVDGASMRTSQDHEPTVPGASTHQSSGLHPTE